MLRREALQKVLAPTAGAPMRFHQPGVHTVIHRPRPETFQRRAPANLTAFVAFENVISSRLDDDGAVLMGTESVQLAFESLATVTDHAIQITEGFSLDSDGKWSPGIDANAVVPLRQAPYERAPVAKFFLDRRAEHEATLFPAVYQKLERGF